MWQSYTTAEAFHSSQNKAPTRHPHQPHPPHLPWRPCPCAPPTGAGRSRARCPAAAGRGTLPPPASRASGGAAPPQSCRAPTTRCGWPGCLREGGGREGQRVRIAAAVLTCISSNCPPPLHHHYHHHPPHRHRTSNDPCQVSVHEPLGHGVARIQVGACGGEPRTHTYTVGVVSEKDTQTLSRA